jgi:hypothetical protein
MPPVICQFPVTRTTSRILPDKLLTDNVKIDRALGAVIHESQHPCRETVTTPSQIAGAGAVMLPQPGFTSLIDDTP